MYQSTFTGAEIDSTLTNNTIGSIEYAGMPSLENLQAQMTAALGFINGKFYIWKNTLDNSYSLVLKISDTVFYTATLTSVI